MNTKKMNDEITKLEMRIRDVYRMSIERPPSKAESHTLAVMGLILDHLDVEIKHHEAKMTLEPKKGKKKP